MAKPKRQIVYLENPDTPEGEPRAITTDGAPVFCAFDELVDITTLKPNPANPNTHGTDQIHLLAQVIRGSGWRAPITVSNQSGLIVSGHGRRLAAIANGWRQVPIERQNYATPDAEKAALLADNRIAELAEMDAVKLADLLESIDADAMPISLTGYTENDIEALLQDLAGKNGAEADALDEIPEAPPVPMSKPGDLWKLGTHRLLCGNATEAAEVERLTAGAKAACVYTDPPYGVNYVTQSGRFIRNDGAGDLLGLLIPAFKAMVRHAEDGAAFYIWHSTTTRPIFEEAMAAAGIEKKTELIWVKNNQVMSYADYQWAHEPCFYAQKVGQSAVFYGDRGQTTILRATLRKADGLETTVTGGIVLTDGTGGKIYIIDKPPKNKKIRNIRLETGGTVSLSTDAKNTTAWSVQKESHIDHPTQKPVELGIRAIENSTKPGDLVLDLFGGSGATLIAAEKTGRRCFMSELDPKYCDLIIKRYTQYTGDTSVKVERDGKEIPLAEVLQAEAPAE